MLSTILILIILGIVMTIPFMIITYFENKNNTQYAKLHLLINTPFILWSFYNFFFSYPNPHNLNSAFIIIPCWLLFCIFYLFYFVKFSKFKICKIIGISLFFVYLIGNFFIIFEYFYK